MTILIECNGQKTAKEKLITEQLELLFGTYKGSMALERDYGIDISVLDRPAKAAEALITSEILTAANKYVPSAEILGVSFDYDNNGNMTVKVAYTIGND